ncbi:hypothetical protein L9F63_006710, partial [Diploptera punctata]
KMVLLPTGPMKFVRLWTTFSLAVGLSKTFVIFFFCNMNVVLSFYLQPFAILLTTPYYNLCRLIPFGTVLILYIIGTWYHMSST